MADDTTPEPPLDAEMDAALRDAYAFAPAAAEEAAARFRLPAPRSVRWPWFAIPVAAAAGLAIGLALRPSPEYRPAPTPQTLLSVGFVTSATKPLRGREGQVLSAGKALFPGDFVEVPKDGRASLILADGTEVRLDRGTRVTMDSRTKRVIDLGTGRLWTRVTKGDPFVIGAGATRVTVLGTELSVSRGKESTEVQLFSGSARVEAGGKSRDLAAGQEVEFEGGELSEARKIYSEAIATGWMLELYAYAGRHERDLAEHMDRMLAEMGRRKIAHLEEDAIVKDLGEVCRIPLARFLVGESARTEPLSRRKAARVLERIADESIAAELASALRDPDPEVRVSAARAIRALSKERVCTAPEEFRNQCDDRAAAAADAWAKTCSPAPVK